MKISVSAFITALAFTSVSAFAQQPGYHIQKTFHIGGPGRWDYVAVNPVNGNIYASHMTQVNILDKNTGDSIGVIPNTDGVHGIAFSPDFKKGFTSNGKLNTVTVFDINTNAILAQVKTGENPDAIMYDPHTMRVYVCNGRSKDMTVINATNNEVVATIPLGGKPETAVSDGAGKIFVNIEDKNEITVINAKTFAIEDHWKIGKGEDPSGLAIDTRTKRLFTGCGNKLMIVLNAENGKVVKELPIGDGCDGVAFDPELKYAFSANGDGTLTIVHEKTASDISVIDNVATKRGARTIAIDEHTHKVYLPTAEFGTAAPGEKRPPAVPNSFQMLVVGK
jgi:YVTN family beta-propeller protein